MCQPHIPFGVVFASCRPLTTLSCGRAKPISAPQCYWDFRTIAEAGPSTPLANIPELVAALDELQKNAFLQRMEADVLLGAYSSGGIDSSTIVALMQPHSARPV